MTSNETTRITFNTGRGYSADGQIIHAEFTPHEKQDKNCLELEMHEGTLKFYDETRGIWGKFNTVIDAGTDEGYRKGDVSHTTLFLYDKGGYQDITFEEAKALKAEADNQENQK